MEKRVRISQRKRKFNFRFFLLLLPVLLGAVVIVVWFGGSRSVGNRMTVVLAGDPVTIVSRDSTDDSFLIVTLPANAVVDAVHGYGQYSLESLWKLGSIEGRDGKVLSESMEELLGVPVPWYIGRKNQLLSASADPLGMAKSVFSLPAVPKFFRGAYTTNMSPREFLTFAWAFTHHRSDNVKIIDLRSSLVPNTRPDGSSVLVADTNSIDQTIASVFEDGAIRKEGLSVAVFNTTAVPSLGNRVSRLLGHAGILVILVGNDRPTIGGCSINGGKKELTSSTAAFIVAQYGCRKVEGSEVRADLIVRIGTEYQSRFVPFTAKNRGVH